MVQEMILKFAVYGISGNYDNIRTKIANVYADFYRNVIERYSQFLRFHQDGDYFTMCDKDQAGHDALSLEGYLPKANETAVQFRAFEKSLHLSAIMKLIQLIGPDQFEEKIIQAAANELVAQRMDQLHEFIIRTVSLARDKNCPLVTPFIDDKMKKKTEKMKWISQLGKADELVIHLVKLGNSVLLAKLMKKAMFLLHPCTRDPHEVCERPDLWDRSATWDDRFMLEVCTNKREKEEKKKRQLIRKATPLLLQMVPYSMCFPEWDEEDDVRLHGLCDTYQIPVLLALATGIDALLLDQTKDFKKTEARDVSSIHVVMFLLGLPFAREEQPSTVFITQYTNFMRMLDQCVTRRLFRVPLQTDLMSLTEDLSVFDMHPKLKGENNTVSITTILVESAMSRARAYTASGARKPDEKS